MADGIDDVVAAGRAEWRAQQEEWMRAAAARRVHERSLSELLVEAAFRGDEITADGGGMTFSGPVIVVGKDYCVLDVQGSDVDVVIHATTLHLARTRGDSCRPRSDPATLRARLLERETARRPVEIGARDGSVLTGVLAVGHDHVVVAAADRHAAVPVERLAWIRAAVIS